MFHRSHVEELKFGYDNDIWNGMRQHSWKTERQFIRKLESLISEPSLNQ